MTAEEFLKMKYETNPNSRQALDKLNVAHQWEITLLVEEYSNQVNKVLKDSADSYSTLYQTYFTSCLELKEEVEERKAESKRWSSQHGDLMDEWQVSQKRVKELESQVNNLQGGLRSAWDAWNFNHEIDEDVQEQIQNLLQ